jgi:hypothetical protein
VAGSCEYGDEPSGFGATELVRDLFTTLSVVQAYSAEVISFK